LRPFTRQSDEKKALRSKRFFPVLLNLKKLPYSRRKNSNFSVRFYTQKKAKPQQKLRFRFLN